MRLDALTTPETGDLDLRFHGNGASKPQRNRNGESGATVSQDGERYRYLRALILRRTAAVNAHGGVTYALTLTTEAPIDEAQLDELLDAAQTLDAGHAEITRGRLAGYLYVAEEGGLAIEPIPPAVPAPVASAPRQARPPAPKVSALPPIKCACGAVRPPTRGRRPDEWTCEACR